MMDTAGNQTDGLLPLEGRFLPTSDSHMEYDDLPALQEVQAAGPTETPAYQVEGGVSHLERENRTYSGPPDTHWLTQLAHIATGPQSPLLQGPPRPSPLRVFGTSCGLHSYARPPPTSPTPPPSPSPWASSHPAPPTGRGRGRRSTRVRDTPLLLLLPSATATTSTTGITTTLLLLLPLLLLLLLRTSITTFDYYHYYFCLRQEDVSVVYEVLYVPIAKLCFLVYEVLSKSNATRSTPSDDEDMGWSHSWPPTAWHCFLKGTRVRFHSGARVGWQDVEDLVSAEDDAGPPEKGGALKVYGLDGLRLTQHSEVISSDQSVLQLTFDPGAFGHTPLTAHCPLDHPFYVKHKGWSSFYPSLTVVHYGIPCYEVERGDVCLPPGHRDAVRTDASLVFNTFRSYDFTPLDSSAVYVLSSMARRRRTSQSSGGAVSPDRELQTADAPSPGPSHSQHQQPIKSVPSSQPGSANATRCKRPMNAFMLFAKKFRVEYTQMHPGKDNRAISVLLGERWKRLRGEERRVFTLEAKTLADQQKILDPDCWKRRRTNSGCQGN
ncbi:HMG box-containing protein 1-like [Gadus macrocephalus]|uniref:HMG box-containing protein 1-like n=1 Tax=Gadus macrocephalus TaxID=80720 RepID=UPI0028CB6D62|nr:HMG box-containing protein 1-like [Gadus macrocephalus]